MDLLSDCAAAAGLFALLWISDFGGTVREISIKWTGMHSFTVTIGDDVDCSGRSLSLPRPPPAMNTVSRMLPEVLWHNKGFLKAMSGLASLMLEQVISASQVCHPTANLSLQIQSRFGSLTPAGIIARTGLRQHWPSGETGEAWGLLDSTAWDFRSGGADFELYDPSRHTLTTSCSSQQDEAAWLTVRLNINLGKMAAANPGRRPTACR
jgi:hypothetical protein